MQDITSLMQTYRECIRHLWNTYFRILEDGDRLFLDVEDELFYSMVVWQIGQATHQKCFHGKPLPYLQVIPITAPKGIPALWARGEDGGRIWNWAEIQVITNDIELRFIDYFDWEQRGYRDWQYYQARIITYPTLPELQGADMLVEVGYAKVFFND